MPIVKTETVTREIDENGVVLRETTTIVEVAPPVDNPGFGLYL